MSPQVLSSPAELLRRPALSGTAAISARGKDNLMRLMTASLCGGIVFVLAACGNTATERAATGGLGGAVIAGPVGAVVGGTVGAATAN